MATAITTLETPPSLMTVIERLASNPNVDVDKIRQLLELQERWEMTRAKAEFQEAKAQFKRNPPEIIKSRVAKMQKDGRDLYSYNYSDLENVTTAIQDSLAVLGITHAFRFKQEGTNISVTCILSRGIYSDDPVTLTTGPDTSGGKNAIQAVASTVSYLERYTLLGAVGMAAGMPDTDGKLDGLPDDDRKRFLQAIATSPDADSLKKVYTTASKAAADSKDSDASKLFAEAKNRRCKQITHA